jgi:hypothetical protein
MYKAGRHEQALQYIRKRWGEMVDWGATTWWEMWQPRASFGHGWSAAPTHDLPAELLGVKPVAPSWAEIEIKPHLADLAWAKGRVPTPKGEVNVEWRVGVKSPKRVSRVAKPSFEMMIDIPADCTARVFVPRIGKRTLTMRGPKRKPASMLRTTFSSRWALPCRIAIPWNEIQKAASAFQTKAESHPLFCPG